MTDKVRLEIKGRDLWLAGLAALFLTVLAVMGASRLQVDGDTVGALAGDSIGYQAFDAFEDDFGLGRADEALLVRANDLAGAEAFAALQNLILDLQFTDGVSEVVSLFTLPSDTASTPFILSEPDRPLSERFEAFLARGDVASALVSADRSGALIHVIATAEAQPGDIAAELPALIEAAAPLDIRAVGQQAVERQISFALIRDQAVVTPIAILICLLAGAILLRSIPAVLACAVPAICGVLWFMGLLGWLGEPLDPWLATLPTLVMVLAFADTLHLFYATRDLPGGLSAALRQVLPAAFMTSLTSALALGSFALAGSDALVGLAIWGPVAVGCGFLAVCLCFPVIVRLLVKDGAARPAGFAAVLAPAHRGLLRPRLVSLCAIVVTVALLPAVNRAEPTFSLSEHIRASSTLGRDMAFMEREGLGSASLFVEIEDADGAPGLLDTDRARIAQVADLLMGGTGITGGDQVALPERFHADDGLSVALPVFLPLGTTPDRFGGALEQMRDALAEAGLAPVTRFVGQSLLAHEVVPETVSAMRVSFYFALAAISIVVALSQRSLILALIATWVSALPMLAIEAALVITGQGMTMTAAFALTVAFGIAVDDTIHYLNRWRRAEGDGVARLADALRHAGAPMVASTLLMTLGFLATLFSATASLPEFGGYVILALWMALLADLFLLPGLMRMLKR